MSLRGRCPEGSVRILRAHVERFRPSTRLLRICCPLRSLTKLVGATPAILVVTGARAQDINLLDELKGAKDELMDKVAEAPKPNLPDLKVPSIKLPEFQRPDIKLPEIKVPNAKMPDVKMPDIKMPDVKMPDVQMPDISMPNVKTPDVKAPAITTPSLPKFRLPSFKGQAPAEEEEEPVATEEKSFLDKLKPYLYTFGGGFGVGSLVGGRIGWSVRGLAFATEQAKNSAISKSSEALTGFADTFKGNPFKGAAQPKKAPAAKTGPKVATVSTPRVVKLEDAASSTEAKDTAAGDGVGAQ